MEAPQTAFRDENSSSDDSDDDNNTANINYNVLTWEESAVEEQQQFYLMFGDRDYNAFKPSEKLFLARHVGFALFGPPQDEATFGNRYTGYSETQVKTLMDMVKTIENCQGSSYEILLATIFVTLKIDDMPMISIPVFRVPKLKKNCVSDDTLFIDSNGRVYKGWGDFLKNNKLPDCTYCYPCNGIYNGDIHDRVLVEFNKTPAAQVAGKVLSGVDTASNVVALTAAGVTMASLAAPVAAGALVAATVGGVAAGVYGIGRSIGVLTDRHQHRQNIGLSDSESRASWLSMVGGVLGVGSGAAMQAVSSLAREGVAIGAIGTAAVTALNVASLVVNGTGLLNNLYALIERGFAGELTTLEVFQFSVSVFFFTHSVVNFQTAATIVRESQQGVINDFKRSLRSNRHRREFRRLTRNTVRGMDNVEGNAKIIRGIKSIHNKDSFFAGLARNKKDFACNKAKYTLTEDGKIRINDQINIHPMKFRTMSRHHRKVILDSTKALSKGEMTHTKFRNEVKAVLRQYKMQFRSALVDTRTDLCKAFGVNDMKNILIRGKRIFNDTSEVVVDLLSSLGQCFGFDDMLLLSKILADKLECSDSKQFIDIVQFLHERISETLSEMETAYLSALNDAQKDDVNFRKDHFDMIYGIVGDRIQYFLKVIFSTFHMAHNISKLVKDYSQYMNSSDFPSRKSEFMVAGMYFKFRDFSLNGDLGNIEILSVASEVLGVPLNFANSQLFKEDNEIWVLCFGENLPTRTVIIETNEQEGTVFAKEL